MVMSLALIWSPGSSGAAGAIDAARRMLVRTRASSSRMEKGFVM